MSADNKPKVEVNTPDFDEFFDPERGDLFIVIDGQKLLVREDGKIALSNENQEPPNQNREN